MANAGFTGFGAQDGYWGANSINEWNKYQAQKAAAANAGSTSTGTSTDNGTSTNNSTSNSALQTSFDAMHRNNLVGMGNTTQSSTPDLTSAATSTATSTANSNTQSTPTTTEWSNGANPWDIYRQSNRDTRKSYWDARRTLRNNYVGSRRNSDYQDAVKQLRDKRTAAETNNMN